MMLMLQYPLLPAAALVCAALAGLAAAKHSAWLAVVDVLLVCGMLLGALACMVPYHEILVLLLPPLLVCLAFTTKEGDT